MDQNWKKVKDNKNQSKPLIFYAFGLNNVFLWTLFLWRRRLIQKIQLEFNKDYKEHK